MRVIQKVVSLTQKESENQKSLGNSNPFYFVLWCQRS